MWRSSRKAFGLRRGFTLIEAMVSLLLLVIVLTVAMTMLFQMRAFAERQQFFMLPRQGARRAAEYLSYYLSSASDLGDVQNNPNAIVAYYNLGGVTLQATYDNLGKPDAQGTPTSFEGPPFNALTSPGVTKFGNVGTDIITLVVPVNPAKYLVAANFPGFGVGKDIWVNFRSGCGGPPGVGADNAGNIAAFKAATGFDGTSSTLLMFEDKDGEWSYFLIPAAAYAAAVSACADVGGKNFLVTADTASPTLPAPPNGAAPLSDPVYLVTGIQFISFRVRTDPVDNVPKLQQKLGLFDPNTDNPGVAFVNVMENIEDLQVAYQYPTGEIWNNTAARRINNGGALVGARCNIAMCDNGVPPQGGPSGVALEPLDISNVIGLRFSVTARSPRLSLAAQDLSQVNIQGDAAHRTLNLHFRPASENHDADEDPVVVGSPRLDLFDHYRATSTMLIRNRILGN